MFFPAFSSKYLIIERLVLDPQQQKKTSILDFIFCESVKVGNTQLYLSCPVISDVPYPTLWNHFLWMLAAVLAILYLTFFFFKLDLFILDRLLHTLFRNEMFSLCMEFDRNEEKSHPFSSVVLTSYEGKHSQLSLVSCNAIIFLRGRLIPEKATCWQGHLPSWLGTVMSGHWEYKYDLFKLLLSPLPLQTDS